MAPKPDLNQVFKDDIASLSGLLHDYESKNQSQKLEIEAFDKTKIGLENKIIDGQKEVQKLQKHIKSLNETIKFEVRVNL